jgi:hypothetical protein
MAKPSDGVDLRARVQPHRRDLASTAEGNVPVIVQPKTEAEPLNQDQNGATKGIITYINHFSGNKPSKDTELQFPAY